MQVVKETENLKFTLATLQQKRLIRTCTNLFFSPLSHKNILILVKVTLFSVEMVVNFDTILLFLLDYLMD